MTDDWKNDSDFIAWMDGWLYAQTGVPFCALDDRTIELMWKAWLAGLRHRSSEKHT